MQKIPAQLHATSAGGSLHILLQDEIDASTLRSLAAAGYSAALVLSFIHADRDALRDELARQGTALHLFHSLGPLEHPDNFQRRWANISNAVRQTLAGGKKVVIVAPMRPGEAGLIGGYLLMDLGRSASQAITDLESAGVRAFGDDVMALKRYRPYLAHASLLGGAIGDSLGADIEFKSLAEIRALHPDGVRRLSRTHAVAPGWFTDDTQMTLFTAEGVIRAYTRGITKGITSLPGVVHHALERWYVTQGNPPREGVDCEHGLITERKLWHRAAPGLTCLSSLENLPSWGGKAENNSKGCGTIMRVAPIAFGVAPEQVRAMALETSALTHGHPLGQISAAAWAELLAKVWAGSSAEDAARTLVRDYVGSGDNALQSFGLQLDRFLHGMKRDGSPESVEEIGGGWVAEEAFAIALYAVLCADSFESGLRIAVTHGGDSDSTGAIAGNMLGLIYPDEVFAHEWAGEVGGREIIARLAIDLVQVGDWNEASARLRWKEYPGY